MESILDKLVMGFIGGLVAYWFAHRKYISQKWWDKRYDLYIESIEILKELSHSLAIYEWALENKQTIDDSTKVEDAYLVFEEGLSKLHGIQNKFLLNGLDEAKMKILPLMAGLSMVHPCYLTKNDSNDVEEIIELVKQSRRMVEGCSGELAFLGKKDLKIGRLMPESITKIIRCKRKKSS